MLPIRLRLLPEPGSLAGVAETPDEERDACAFAIEARGSFAGMIDVEAVSVDEVSLRPLIHPSWRASGVATAALGQACDWIQRAGVAALATMVVDPANPSAVRLAEGAGFAPCATTLMQRPGAAPRVLYARSVA